MDCGADAERRRQPPARVRARRPTPTSASCCCAPRPRRPRGGVPRAAAAYLERALRGARAGRRPRPDARAARHRSRSTPACRTRAAGCARRCARSRDRESRDRRAHPPGGAEPDRHAGDAGLAQLFEQELAGETDPDVRLAVEAASLDALLILPERHERARAARRGDRPAAGRRTRCSCGSCSPTGRGSGSSWRRRRRRRLGARWPARRSTGRPAAARGAPARGLHALRPRRWSMTDDPQAGERAIAALREAAMERGSLRLRVAAAWYAAELALRTGARGRGREPRAARRSTSLDDDIERLQRRRGRGAGLRARRARRVRRGARAAARAPARRRARARRSGRSACATPAPGCGWPRATSSAPTPRRWRRARCASEQGRPNPALDAVALDRRASRSPTSGAATRRPRWPTPSSRWRERFGAPVADRRRPARPRRRRARPRGARRAVRARAGRRRRRAAGLAVVRAAARARQRAGLTSAGASRRATRCVPALADADAAGAVVLAQRARRELVATGLRPRQAAIEGAAALTPRQRQICELAAAGKGNRAIAQELFLSRSRPSRRTSPRATASSA